MVHHPNTIKGLHAKQASERSGAYAEAREDKPAQPSKFASHRSADLGGKHSSPATHPDVLQPGESAIVPARFGRRVATWFDDRKITQNATLDAQMGKLKEEFEELDQGIEDNDLTEIKDGIGDMAVVLAGMAHMCGMTFEECCEHAWNEIKDRTGHLNEDGVFVKDD